MRLSFAILSQCIVQNITQYIYQLSSPTEILNFTQTAEVAFRQCQLENLNSETRTLVPHLPVVECWAQAEEQAHREPVFQVQMLRRLSPHQETMVHSQCLAKNRLRYRLLITRYSTFQCLGLADECFYRHFLMGC